MPEDVIEAPNTTEQKKPLSLLASEHFGGEFHGEIEKLEEVIQADLEEADEEPVKADDEAVKADEEADEDSGSGEDQGEQDSEDDEEVPISSLDELIAANEWDPEWVQSLGVAIKVDGSGENVKLSDLVKGYQMNRAADKRLEDAKARSTKVNEELGQKQQQIEAQFSAVGEILNRALQSLDHEFKEVNWKELKADDPGKYAALRADFSERRSEIDGLVRESVQKYQNSVLERQEELREKQKAFLQEQQNLLLNKLPDWRDPEKAKAGRTQLVGYLETEGFSQDEIMSLSDHRALILARKAMLYDQGKAKSDVAKKKITKVPKILKPGTTKPASQINKEKVAQHRRKLRQTGSIEDAMALLRAGRG